MKTAKKKSTVENEGVTGPWMGGHAMSAADALRQLYAARNILRAHFPELPFTLDGRMVGDIGEAIAATKWGFKPLPSNSKTHDAETPDGRKVQIKTTQQTRGGSPVGLGLDKRTFEHLIVIQIREDASYEVLYDGPGTYIDQKREGKKSASLSVNQLRQLDRHVPEIQKALSEAQRKGIL